MNLQLIQFRKYSFILKLIVTVIFNHFRMFTAFIFKCSDCGHKMYLHLTVCLHCFFWKLLFLANSLTLI